MPVSLPFAASGRDLSDKPRRIPKSVQLACLDMVHRGIDFIEAARANGIKPDTLRRHLHRIETIAFIRRERAAFRTALCSANEFYLAQIRANSQNEMARTRAISILEEIDGDSRARPMHSVPEQPGICIRIINVSASEPPLAPPPAKVIDAGD
jgi:hypothetical protein